MACELWLRGTAERGGPFPIDKKCGNWTFGSPLPTITFLSSTPNWTFYSSSNGCFTTNTGWRTTPEFYTKDCSPPPGQQYDCLNGSCVPKQTYNTPGAFSTIALCQSSCGQATPCDGECVPVAEIAALQSAASGLRARLCG